MDRKRIIRLIFFVVFLAIMAGLTIALWPFFKSIGEPGTAAQLKAQFRSTGLRGWLAFVGLQMVQIIVPVIPGEPVEILGGMIYGVWGGFFTCMFGITLAMAAIYFFSRRFGPGIIKDIIGEKNYQKFEFLLKSDNLNTFIFFLFFIPGTPKDTLAYFAPVTPLSFVNFILLTSFARSASVASST